MMVLKLLWASAKLGDFIFADDQMHADENRPGRSYACQGVH
jgi:hypothetical protein